MNGAQNGNRTRDLVLTKDVLYLLSYISLRPSGFGWTGQPDLACPAVAVNFAARRRLERETGIEPATNSLEGCDSTTELLPLTGGSSQN